MHMSNALNRLGSILCFVAAVGVAHAAPMNKCTVNGSVTYQQAPCPVEGARKKPTLEELNAAERIKRAEAASAAAARSPEPAPRSAVSARPAKPAAQGSRFSCDGRTRCPQMKSCEEARYFLAHCPSVEMDGDGDGIPCEQQWCPG